MQKFADSFEVKDEIYQIKGFSREKCRVLMTLDASKLDLANPRVHRADHDFAVRWAKTYGKGRVHYTTLGHVEENWDRADYQDMYTKAIEWALGIIDGEATPKALAK